MENKHAISDKSIFVKSELALFRVDLDDIYFIEGLKDYILIHTSNNTLKTHIPMKDIEKLLNEKDFVRIHKSYIVRIDKIAYIKYPNLMIENKLKILQIGATFKDSLYKSINILKD